MAHSLSPANVNVSLQQEPTTKKAGFQQMVCPARPEREDSGIDVGPEKWQRVHIKAAAGETKTLGKQTNWLKGVAMCERGTKVDLMKRELDNWLADFKKLITEQQDEDSALKDLKNGLEASWTSFDKGLNSRE